MIIRFFDIIISFIGLFILSPIILLLLLFGFLDTGMPLFLQSRVGKDKRTFKLIKFRSMHINTKSVASHLANASSITSYGFFIRKFKLDEIPQLWNVLIGDMSLVGPRPNLFNQEELIKEREQLGIYYVRPGITGLAQIHKIDMSTPKKLAEMDAKMIMEYNVINYFRYIFITLSGKGFGDRVM